MEVLRKERFHPVAASLIRRPGGRLLFVSKKDDWTIPTEHFEEEKDNDLKDSVLRCAKEELGILPEEIFIRDFLGPLIRNKDSLSAKNFQFVYCRVSSKVADKIRFKEGAEDKQLWLYPWEALDLLNLDEVGREAINRYLEKYPCQQVSARLCFLGSLGRKLLWREKTDSDFQKEEEAVGF
jgi:ADP-ribose pyrophosphatase YjhB (NUDIX family)